MANINKLGYGVIGLVVVVLLVIVFIMFFSDNVEPAMTAEQAIAGAQSYQPDGICGQALTSATHTETGASYTFPTTCLAEGWVAN